VLAHLAPVVAARGLQSAEVHYRIEATVLDTAGLVRGVADVRFRHITPDTIRSLTIALGLNHYRPGSRAWPKTDQKPQGTSGYLTLGEVRLNDVPVALAWPDAPDSSAALLVLPEPIGAGDSATLSFRWESRPPTLPWRSQHLGRRLDLIDWYPQVIDDASGAAVAFPAQGTFLVQVDVADDQVLGGTGVLLCGDPGWTGAAASPHPTVTRQPDFYPSPRDPSARVASCSGSSPGRKRVTWYAEGVTEFAMALSPDFRYEEGDFQGRPVRALYQRGGERVWGAGLATRRTETAMAWTLELGDRYPWPHLTIVEAIDQNGVARPMMLFAGAPSQAVVLNLMGLLIAEHMLLGGTRVFTVGTAAYQASWFFEVLGRRGDYQRVEREVLDWDLDRLGLGFEPLPTTPTSPCATTICRRAEFMSYQLRRWGGTDEAMRKLYRTLYQHYLLKVTPPGTFQGVARRVMAPSPDPLYQQIPRGTLYDDAIGGLRRRATEDGGWHTTVVVNRRAPGLFPQTVWVIAARDTAVARAASLAKSETLTVVTRSQPRRVILDPLVESHDWNMLNNERGFGAHIGWFPLAPGRRVETYLDTYFSRRSARHGLTQGWAPTVWYNDAGGWTFGIRLREDYLSRFELNEFWTSLSTGLGTEGGRTDFNAQLRLRNPVWLRAPGWSQSLRLAWVEGRAAADLEVAKQFRDRIADSTLRQLRVGLHWLTVAQPAYLTRGYYDDAGTAELVVGGEVQGRGRWPVGIDATVAGGYAYPNDGTAIAGGGYGRFTLAATLRGPTGGPLTVGARVYGGAVLAADSVPRQRRIYLAGADPYQRFNSPFLRSRGSILVGQDVYYHAPGGAGVRGLDPELSAPHALGGSLEVEAAPVRGSPGSLISRIAIAVFADGALADGDLNPGGGLEGVGDAGVGIRLDQRLGQTAFQTRMDFPLWVSRPALAQDGTPSGTYGFRWSLSFTPPF
jgi:hypothetical protein